MAEYKYTAVNSDGVIFSEAIVADSEEEVELILKKDRLSAINIRLIPDAKETLFDHYFNKVTATDKAQFLEYFASMLEAGLTVSDVLRAFYEDYDKPLLRKFVKDTQYGIRNGKTLSDCFAEYPDLFPQLYVGMIKVGEASGTLAGSLRHLATQLKKQNELKGKVKNAMIYPTVLLIAVVLVVSILIFFVFPRLEDFFGNSKLELPPLTMAMINMSKFISGKWFIILPTVIGLIFGYKKLMKIDKFRAKRDKLMMRMPLFGNLVKTTSVATFARTLGSLLSSGVNILESVDVVKASMDSQVYKDILSVMKEDIEKGNSIADSMKKFPDYFSPFEVRVLSIGERTGEVASGLLSIAEFYEKRTFDALGGLSTAIEPIILVIMGGVVVVVALSVITPIYGMLSGVQGL